MEAGGLLLAAVISGCCFPHSVGQIGHFMCLYLWAVSAFFLKWSECNFPCHFSPVSWVSLWWGWQLGEIALLCVLDSSCCVHALGSNTSCGISKWASLIKEERKIEAGVGERDKKGLEVAKWEPEAVGRWSCNKGAWVCFPGCSLVWLLMNYSAGSKGPALFWIPKELMEQAVEGRLSAFWSWLKLQAETTVHSFQFIPALVESVNFRANQNLKHITEGITQLPREHWQAWGINYLARNLVPVFGHFCSKDIFLNTLSEGRF